MGLRRIGPGSNVPNEVNVVIEIPMRGEPVKYEVCKDSGTLCVDRFMPTAMFYPANYGYVPNTLSEDGDPVDVLVITPVPLISGSVISSRLVGMLKMTDESGVDAKLIAVPGDKLSRSYRNVKSCDDLPYNTTAAIEHFFEHYKDLDEGKWVKIDGWDSVDAAKNELLESIKRFEKTEKS
jgi:inorganic pyrophosphatase